ncbi:unnamed protein product, partial [Brachionus calyciflorus]
VYEFESCGNESCKNWIFESSPSIGNYSNLINCGSFTTKNGLNRISLPQPIWIRKGSIIVLHTSTWNPILIDSIDEHEIPDYSFAENVSIRIDMKRSLRFCFRALIDQSFYYTKFSYFREIEFETDENFRLVDIVATIVENNMTINKRINVSNVKETYEMDLICDQFTYDLNLNCTIQLISSSPRLNFTISVSDNTTVISSSLSKNTLLVNYFGLPISKYLMEYNGAFSKDRIILLTNTEFKFDSQVIGFELFTFYNLHTSIPIEIISFNQMCNSTITCSEYLINQATITNYKTVASLSIQTTKNGLNTVFLKKPIWVTKGSMVVIKLASVYYDCSGQAKYSDYLFTQLNKTSFKIERLNTDYNYAHYFNVLLDTKFYINSYYFMHEFPDENIYNINVALNSKILHKRINIKKTRLIQTICSNSTFTIDKIIQCSSIVTTFNKKDEVEVNVQNDSKMVHNFSDSNYISYFGIEVPTYIDKENIESSIIGDFILPLTEFKFDAYILGFQFYANKSGQILVYVS